MSHVILWRFLVPEEQTARFVAAYGPDGDWAKLFGEAEGFERVELWRSGDGRFTTVDRWNSEADFDRFKANFGDPYNALDAALEGLASEETFIGVFQTV